MNSPDTANRPDTAADQTIASDRPLDAKSHLACAIDLGGTKIAAVIGDMDGTILAETKVETDRRGGAHLVDQFAGVIKDLVAAAGCATADVKLVVLGTPGVLDPQTGHIHAAPNIPGVEQMDLRQRLSERVGLPVLIENDVNLAALGEGWRGHASTTRDFALIALGTGVGMGIVSNGALTRGARGAAGEIAYMPIGGDPFDPGGFTLGTLETAIGSVAMIRRYAGFGGAADATVAELFLALEAGDAAAIAAVDETARIVALAIASIGALLDPELVITGGSIGSRPELVEAIRRYLPRCTPFPPRIEISQFGGRAALIGGLAMAAEYMLKNGLVANR